MEVTLLKDWANDHAFRCVLERIVPIFNARSENVQYSLLDKMTRVVAYTTEFYNYAAGKDLALKGEEKRRRIHQWALERMGFTGADKSTKECKLFKSYAQWKDLKTIVQACDETNSWQALTHFSQFVAGNADSRQVDDDVSMSALG